MHFVRLRDIHTKKKLFFASSPLGEGLDAGYTTTHSIVTTVWAAAVLFAAASGEALADVEQSEALGGI